MAGPDRSFSGPELPRDATALEFEKVTLQLFPMRANLFALEKFCDNYLNIAPEIARFRPVVPFVLMAAINYPKMSQAASNLGWVSQNEVVFSVPVEWQRFEGGEWRQDWASVSPYLFVDNERSIQVGREVYGWPKVLADFRPGANRWTAKPRSRKRLLNLETRMFSKLYAGEPLESRTLLEIEHIPAETLLRFPPNFERMFLPAMKWPRVAIDSMFQAWESMPEAATLLNWLRPMIDALAKGRNALGTNTINLKQFRSSETSGDRVEGSACYQALVNAKMQFMKYHGSGFLGDIEMLRGDPTGGFRINLHRNSSYPIIESLGIQTTQEIDRGEYPISVIEPLLPFWVEADVRYLPGERICWRAEGHDWSTSRQLGPAITRDDKSPKIPYITTLGPVAQPIEGPFDFWDATMRLIPLRADKETLCSFVREYLSRLDDDERIENIDVLERGGDALVLLLVSTYGKLSAQANDVGWWARRQLSFTIPLIVTPRPDRKRASSRIRGIGSQVGNTSGQLGPRRSKSFPALLWPYVFNDSPIAVSTGREFTGQPSEYAIFEEGVDPWLDLEWREKRNLMSLSTNEYPALGVGQPAEPRVLLEIVEGPEIPEFPSESEFEDAESVLPVDPGLHTTTELTAPPPRRRPQGFDSISATNPFRDTDGIAPIDAEFEPTTLASAPTGLIPTQLFSGHKSGMALTGEPPMMKGTRGVRITSGEPPPDTDPVDHPDDVTGPIDPSDDDFVVSGLYLDNVFLKQFRDAEDPNLACYQSVVMSRTEIGRWRGRGHAPEFFLSDRDYEVRIHDYRSRPIARTLGLIPDEEELRQDGTRVTVHRTHSDRNNVGPVWLKADLRQQSGQPLFWRTVSEDWHEVEGAWDIISESAQEDTNIRTLEDFLQALMQQATVHAKLVFTYDSRKYAVVGNQKDALDRIAIAMIEERGLRIQVSGHSDSTGSEAQKMNISRKRAEAVRRHLIKRGIAEERITTEAMSDGKPVGDNETEEGRRANRRVEIVVKLS